VRGDLNSFHWLQGDITPEYQRQNLVHIIYAPINFKDVMITSGKVNMDSFASRGRLEECFIGLEYVGIDNTGHRVMGITENRYIIFLECLKYPSFIVDFIRFLISNLRNFYMSLKY